MANTATRRDPSMLQSSISAGTVIVATTGSGAFQQIMLDGRHVLHADEPVVAGGGDTGPGPYELILMALGSCTSMTVHLYAAQKKWPLDQVVVRLSQLRGPGPEMSLIVREACADPPPLPSERRRLARRLVKRHALSHDERRSAGHKDPERIADCHLRIGLWHWANHFW